jgi:hypothetical protein
MATTGNPEPKGTDTVPAPATGHNLPPIAKLAAEMTHHAGLWSRNAGQGEKHQREIMVRAYQLCLWAEDPDTDLLITGLLSKADIPHTKRSHRCTQLLRYAFRKVEVEPEPSQLSRWAWSMQHALNQTPRPAPADLLDFVKNEGGDVACRKKARDAETATADGSAPKPEPRPIPLPSCSLPDELDGVSVTARKTEGGWVLIPRKVLSFDTTPAPGRQQPE